MNKVGYAVELNDVYVRINRSEVIRGITIKVPLNTIYVIMGPSGSGKTTILRLISRLIDLIPDVEVTGSISVLGMDALRSDPYVLRRYVGMVFQTPNPFPHMSIYDNVAIAARINGVANNRDELDRIVRWALERAMLWDEVKGRLND
ncbi:MAG: ATP-binding cassette domain-containing protein, partial [Sulfolobales archaeon]